MLFLKSLPADLVAQYKFQWPNQVGAIVTSTTWDPNPVCGGGLHGLINGEGHLGLLCHAKDAVWIAFESVDEHGNPSDAEAVAIDKEKGKCHHAIIRAIGTRAEATEWLIRQGCKKVPYAALIADDIAISLGYQGAAITEDENGIELQDHSCRAIAGNDCNISVSTGSHGSLILAGNTTTVTLSQLNKAIVGETAEIAGENYNKVVAGPEARVELKNRSDVITGMASKITVGDNSSVIAQRESTVIGGHGTMLISEAYSNLTTGSYGTAIADRGGFSKAQCGYFGIAAAGQNSQVAGNLCSVLILRDEASRPVVAIVGQNGIEPNVYYRLNSKGQFVKADTGT